MIVKNTTNDLLNSKEKKMRQKILVIFIILAILLSACSQKNAINTDEPTEIKQTESVAIEETASTTTVTLSYVIWDSIQAEAHERIIDAFEAAHPNIKVNLEVFSWDSYWDKLNTALAGNDAYDVFWLNVAGVPKRASKGLLLNLQPYMDADPIDFSAFPDYLVEAYQYNGDTYGIPKDIDTIALFYNKDLFDAAGVEYPNADWTWDDLYNAAAALTTEDVWGFGHQLWGQPDWWNFVYQNNGQLLSEDKTRVVLDDPAACGALEYLYSFVEAGYAPDGSVLATSDPEMQLFPGGKLAMFPDGSWMVSEFANLDFNVGIAPLPMGITRATNVHGLGNVVWAGTQYPDEAWEFVKFLGSDTAMQIQAETGVVIPANENYRSLWTATYPELDLQVFLDGLDYGFTVTYSEIGTAWEDAIYSVINDTWNGNISIDQTCQLAAESGTSELNP